MPIVQCHYCGPQKVSMCITLKDSKIGYIKAIIISEIPTMHYYAFWFS